MPNFAIGHDTPAVRGGDNSSTVQKRCNSTYNQTLKGNFTTQFVEANSKNRNYREFIDSNKFDYGYDPNGGSRALSLDKRESAGKNTKDNNPFESLKYKERDQKQSFKAYGGKDVQNSGGKHIGDTLDKFVKNEID